ncbi:MAG: hypothetical protein ABW088_15155, partial [Sedimenticola sp.]
LNDSPGMARPGVIKNTNAAPGKARKASLTRSSGQVFWLNDSPGMARPGVIKNTNAAPGKARKASLTRPVDKIFG